MPAVTVPEFTTDVDCAQNVPVKVKISKTQANKTKSWSRRVKRINRLEFQLKGLSGVFGLKIQWAQAHVGSIPTSGTNEINGLAR